nr:hypothetical protein [Tanacetum cinerariifolium]
MTPSLSYISGSHQPPPATHHRRSPPSKNFSGKPSGRNQKVFISTDLLDPPHHSPPRAATPFVPIHSRHHHLKPSPSHRQPYYHHHATTTIPTSISSSPAPPSLATNKGAFGCSKHHQGAFGCKNDPRGAFGLRKQQLSIELKGAFGCCYHRLARCSCRGHLRRAHIYYSPVFLEGTPARGTYSLRPNVLGGQTCEGYIFISAHVFWEGTPMMGIHGFHYCPSVLGGDTYNG